MTAIRQDADSNEALSADSAAEALLNKWKDAGQLSDPDGGANTPDRGSEAEPDEDEEDNSSEDEDLDLDEDSEDANDDDDDNDADADDEKADEPVEVSDEAVVKIKVDGEERTVPVKDLKRLFGQEAALTRKSQEVAQAKKEAEDTGAKFSLAAGKLLEKAQKRFEPYAGIDWTIAQKTLSDEEFVALRTEAKDAYEDLKFLHEELDGAFKEAQAARQNELKKAAEECIKTLETDVPGFNEERYKSLLDFAANERGFDRDFVASITDPNILKLFIDAQTLAEARKRAATKRKASSAKRTVKPKNRSSNNLGKPTAAPAMERLRQTGTADDAAEALLARWRAQGDD
jgi:hypothetical protein